MNAIVRVRDGGCILRHYGKTGKCGGFRKDGGLILQAEHLHTRANAASYSDSRLVVCLCKYHHIFWKPQYSSEYWQIVERHIGMDRTALLHRVQEDDRPHKMDWKMEELALKQELKELQQEAENDPFRIPEDHVDWGNVAGYRGNRPPSRF